MTIITELKNVSRILDGRPVLNNVSFNVQQGEILALLGPNGSGKTTLLKILALIDKPSTGAIYFRDHKITDSNMELMRKNCTMVFQRTIIFNTSVFNNVAYGLKMRKTSKNEIAREVEGALKLVRLEGFGKRHVKKLSGGEQQRVALARALVLNTPLLLLDEPTANLDPKTASIIEDVISTVNRESETTIVMATHNMFQAKSLPHRVALINDGKIDEIGTTAQVFGRLSKTLAGFAALDNVFSGRAEATESGTTLVNIGDGVLIEMTAKTHGQVSVFVSPEDIIISRNPFVSSARNIFKGKITEIVDSGSLVRLKVYVGKSFVVQITKRSFNEMNLGLNTEVFLTFKASSVQMV